MATVTDTEVTNNADLVRIEGRDRITGPALFVSGEMILPKSPYRGGGWSNEQRNAF